MNPHLSDGAKSGDHAPKSSRREAREAVLQALYAFEFTHDDLSRILEEVCELFSEPAMAFVKKLVGCAVEHQPELDQLIRSRTQNWDFERIAIIDRLLLRMAICEFIFFEDIPPKVSINEMIEISKRFSTEKSSKFINGILDSVFDDLRKGARIHKTGRGVIEE